MLTLQFVPYGEIANLETNQKLEKLLRIVKEDKIVVMEGRLRKEEEKELIRKTMETVDDKFKAIEIAVIYPSGTSLSFLEKLKDGVIELMLGDRQGITVIGPATIIKEIKRDPDKIQLFTEEIGRKKKRRK